MKVGFGMQRAVYAGVADPGCSSYHHAQYFGRKYLVSCPLEIGSRLAAAASRRLQVTAKMDGYTQNNAVLGRREETAEVMGDTAGGRQTVEVFDHDNPLFLSQRGLRIALTWTLSWTLGSAALELDCDGVEKKSGGFD